MPKHGIYCEPFFGGGSVLLTKPRSEFEFASDIDAGLMLFWGVVAGKDDDADEHRYAAFESRLRFNKYKAETFALAKGWIEHDCPPLDVVNRSEYAAFYMMRNRMSRGGMGNDFAWSERLRGGQPGDANAWQTSVNDLRNVHNRMRGVDLQCRDAVEAIEEHDSYDTLTYLDPPYLRETRTAPKIYKHEAANNQRDDIRWHSRLLKAALRCKGSVIISGYRSELYDRALRDWEFHSKEVANDSGQTKVKSRRVECLWIKRS